MLGGVGEQGLRLPAARVVCTLLVAMVLSVLPAMAGPRLASAAACTAQAPNAFPNDPEYARAENDQSSGYTWDGEQWYLYGCLPQGVPLASDPEGASGMSVDRVWNDLGNRGRDDVKVAYMEGGINWRIGSSCELKDRAWLNTAELPHPQDAQGKTATELGQNGDPYDLNADGVVNVEDYLDDPRIPAAEVGMHRSPGDVNQPFLHQVCATTIPDNAGTNITPEDLIVTFGHCQVTNGNLGDCPAGGRFDNDGNGYPNDINGWNFNRDNNDPQTEQSVYGHFNGESGQLVGEADNGYAGAGMCPLCRYIPIKAGDEAIDRPDRVAEAIAYAADNGVNVMDVTDASVGLTPEMKAVIDYAYHKGMVIAWASNDFESADHTDGMYWPHVWPGNSVTGDQSTRGGATCPPQLSSNSLLCAFVKTNHTYRARSSLTSYGPHSLFSVPNTDGSTSTGTPTQAGVAALVVAEGLDAVDANQIAFPLDAEEVRQVVRSTASYIGPLPACPLCFQGISGASFNIQYGYGRPNVYRAAVAVDNGEIPPTADILSPDWYQLVDPTRQSTLHVTADVAARRATGYTWELQYGLGPEPLDSAWQTFASGAGTTAQSVGGDIDLSAIPASAWSGAYSVDPSSRLTIESYDVSVRAVVHADGDTGANPWKTGEDRRAFHLRHDDTEHPGFPLHLGSSGESSPAMADIEGRGWLDIILATADGKVHAIRPDGNEAPGFPVTMGLVTGMDPDYDVNYLHAPAWKSGLPRPHEESLGPIAVGDLRHDGGLEIVAGTLSGHTYAWDGAGHLLPGFPVLNGDPAYYHMAVPTPDTPYSFEPENYAGVPVLADLTNSGQLDIIQTAADNQVHAWHVTPGGVEAVPGWPVSTLLPAGTVPVGQQQTHDSKVVPTPAIADINGDGTQDVVVGLNDTILGTLPAGAGVKAFLMAYDGRGTAAPGGALLPGYPVKIQGLIQGYGVAQDFVTQGVESPVIYDAPAGPQAVVNANLFAPYRVDLATATPAANPFIPTTIPNATPQDCPPSPTGIPSAFPNAPGVCTLVGFTTSASVGNALGTSTPQVFQPGSAGVEVALGITQAPGFGVRVDNGIGGWDPATGLTLPQYSHYIQGLAFFTAPAIADVSGDGRPDILQATDSAALMGFDGLTGAAASGFPKWSGGFSLFTPAIGDLEGTGHVAVANMVREGDLHVWDTPGATSANHEAWHWHQDDRNTGHYGTDTRPPAAVRLLTVAPGDDADDLLTFTSPGDDWNDGTATTYQLVRSSQPITQANFKDATPVTIDLQPAAAGTKQQLKVPHVDGQEFYALRAVDDAGNIGPVRVVVDTPAVLPPAGPPLPRSLPNTAGASTGAGGGLLLGLAVAAFSLRRRRRRRAA